MAVSRRVLHAAPSNIERAADLRRRQVAVPVAPRIDALFLVLRRMRMPAFVLITLLVVGVIGFRLIPGVTDQGAAYHMTVFEAFYFVSYTMMTIGYGEYPFAFTTNQRLWGSVVIYSSVVGWAYAIGTFFSLMQDSSFKGALARQRFARRIRAFRHEFVIVAGYGHTGRIIAQALDERGRRIVVLDRRQERIDVLESDSLIGDVPGLAADPGSVQTLGLAGLGHPECRAVLAMTEDDQQNLAIVMAARLLRPQIRVIARCANRDAAREMALFDPEGIINPFDRYGAYLVLALHRPAVFQLVTWLLAETGEPPKRRPSGLADGPWIVLSDGEFGSECAFDLRREGLEVRVMHPDDATPDLTGVVGFVSGSSSDTVNLAAAAQVRRTNRDIFLCVRQQEHTNRALMTAFAPDSSFFPYEIVTQECLARMVSPGYWAFIDYVMKADDEWADSVMRTITKKVGRSSPDHQMITIGDRDAPAVRRWLGSRELTLGELLRDPADRDQHLPVVGVEMLRHGERTILPALDTKLAVGDKIVLVASPQGLTALGEALYDDSTLQYLVTGRDVPTSLMWRLATNRILVGDRRDKGGEL
ncbi:MAG TPA: NAD-binding protein [Propionibacteriaceae bacterium]|nr:NAD-binding protein [Propionibacteriaceae bacterium]